MAYALSVWAGWIAWHDWRKQRITNAGLVLVLVPALLSLAINQQGLLHTSILDSFLGLFTAAGVMFPGYLLRYTGAGDVKLASTLGLLVGVVPVLKLLLIFALLLGALSLITLWRYRGLPQILKRRIPAAPALALAFAGQLLAGEISELF